MNIAKVDRRGFLRNVFSAGAVIIGARFAPADYATTAWQPSVFLGLNPDGSVIIVAHRSEMGTGARSALPMLLADELDADWKRVRVEQAVGHEKYGSQNTDGSCSVRDFYDTIRDAGATARLMLERIG